VALGEFGYRSTKDGRVFVSWRGRDVATLTGAEASRFLAAAERADEAGRQHLMARATGNFRRGNERAGRAR
jgi:hypothetical protein